jgi:uncharacterized protein (TIRG00374 family)
MIKSILSSQAFHIALGIFVSLGLLVWISLVVDWPVVMIELSRVEWFMFVPLTAIFFFHFFLRAVRWRYLLPEGQKVPLSRLFECIMLGNLATFVLPLRAGEIIRPYALTLFSPFSFSAGFVSVVIERFFDLAAVLLSFVAMLFFIESIPAWAHNGALSLGVMACGILGFITVGVFFPDRAQVIADFFITRAPSKVRPALQVFSKDFISGTSVLGGKRGLITVAGLTIIVWITSFMISQGGFYLFGMGASFWEGVTVGVILALAVAAPSAPGFIGIYQTGCIAAFSLFGYSKESALAYAIVTHAYQFAMIVAVGIFILVRNNLSLGALRARRAA